MSTVRSEDGTTIAYDRHGAGPPLILVGGAFQHRAFDPSTVRLGELLGAAGLSVFHYDRRGRGESGDTAPYAVERELEDLDAMIDVAGGSAALFGSSSGGNLALEAAMRGLAVTRLAVWEPNYLVDDSRPPLPNDYVAHLDELIAAGRRGDTVEYFMMTAIGIPPEFVAQMRDTPMWKGMEGVAHTLPYDGQVVAGFALPASRLRSVVAPTLVLDGGQTPWMASGARALADALPDAQHRTLEGQQHGVEPDAIAPVLADFFAMNVQE
jgi:pimeloyl-ACP methyl ester carboxylesterase